MYQHSQYPPPAASAQAAPPSSLSGYEGKPLPYLPPQGPQPGQHYLPHGQAPGYAYALDGAAYGAGATMNGYPAPAGHNWQAQGHMNSIPGGGMGIPSLNPSVDPQYPPHHAAHAPLAGLNAQMGMYPPPHGEGGGLRGYTGSESPNHSSVSGYAGEQPAATDAAPASHLLGYEGDHPAKKPRSGPQGWTPVSSPAPGEYVSLPPKPAAGSQGKAGGLPVSAPPAKAACLSCRARKARCDGQQPVCKQCISKGRECVFVKSRRGGARKKRASEEGELARGPLRDKRLTVHSPQSLSRIRRSPCFSKSSIRSWRRRPRCPMSTT